MFVKTQILYRMPAIAIRHLIRDVAYDVGTLWEFMRERGLIPAFALMHLVELPDFLEVGITLSNMHQFIRGDDRLMPRIDQPVWSGSSFSGR